MDAAQSGPGLTRLTGELRYSTYLKPWKKISRLHLADIQDMQFSKTLSKLNGFIGLYVCLAKLYQTHLLSQEHKTSLDSKHYVLKSHLKKLCPV